MIDTSYKLLETPPSLQVSSHSKASTQRLPIVQNNEAPQKNGNGKLQIFLNHPKWLISQLVIGGVAGRKGICDLFNVKDGLMKVGSSKLERLFFGILMPVVVVYGAYLICKDALEKQKKLHQQEVIRELLDTNSFSYRA